MMNGSQKVSQRTTASRSSQRTQSTPKPSQSRRNNETQQRSPEDTRADIDRLVAEVIQYFLVMEQKRFPVKKADITKLISGKCLPKTFKAVMVKAGKYLEEVFGFSIHEFDEKSGHFVLLNQIKKFPKNFSHQELSETNTILFLTLSAIYLSEGLIIEDEIWNMLNILGYNPEDYKKLVTQDFVKKLYINVETVPQSDPPKFNFQWGERATVEFTKKQMLEFASKIYGMPCDQFGQLWHQAEKEAQIKAKAD